MERPWHLRCIECGVAFDPLVVRYRCECGGILDVVHTFNAINRDRFRARRNSDHPADRSGVWRYREIVLPLADDEIVTRGEGNTNVYRSERLDAYCGVSGLALKHEGENPTGSFKDRGMAVGMSVARLLGVRAVACASTGNTSASLASYAAVAGLPAFVFIPGQHIASGKLSQTLAYGAHTLQLDGNFDKGMRIVQEVCARTSIYLLNSINPFRIEGQKSIGFELLDQLGWEVPDWIVLPGGNLGNSSAIGKGLQELHDLGIIDRLPRLAVIQARGANPLYRAYSAGEAVRPLAEVDTLATAIRIGDPVSWRKCVRALDACQGVVTDVDDAAIMDAKAQVDAAGIGAEPASCATVAGVRRLVSERVIAPTDRVCGILTGHLLKDPDTVISYHQGQLRGIPASLANPAQQVDAKLPQVLERVEAVLDASG